MNIPMYLAGNNKKLNINIGADEVNQITLLNQDTNYPGTNNIKLKMKCQH